MKKKQNIYDGYEKNNIKCACHKRQCYLKNKFKLVYKSETLKDLITLYNK